MAPGIRAPAKFPLRGVQTVFIFAGSAVKGVPGNRARGRRIPHREAHGIASPGLGRDHVERGGKTSRKAGRGVFDYLVRLAGAPLDGADVDFGAAHRAGPALEAEGLGTAESSVEGLPLARTQIRPRDEFGRRTLGGVAAGFGLGFVAEFGFGRHRVLPKSYRQKSYRLVHHRDHRWTFRGLHHEVTVTLETLHRTHRTLCPKCYYEDPCRYLAMCWIRLFYDALRGHERFA